MRICQLLSAAALAPVLGLLCQHASADVLFMAHYDTSRDADYAAGSASERNRHPGEITSDSQGMFGEAGHFAEFDTFSYALAENISTYAGTAMLWAKRDTAATDPASWFSIGTANPGSAVTDIWLRSDGADTKLSIRDASGRTYAMKAPVAAQDEWNHYAFTWQTSGDGKISIRLYVNGQQPGNGQVYDGGWVDSELTVTGKTWGGFNFSDGTAGKIADLIYIGGVEEYKGYNADGSIDEVVITNDALDASAIQSLYEIQAGQDGRALQMGDFAVPEPTSAAMFLGGALALWVRPRARI